MKEIKESQSRAKKAELTGNLRVVPAIHDEARRNRHHSATTAPRMEISTRRQTHEEERQFEVALGHFLDEMVREYIEGWNRK